MKNQMFHVWLTKSIDKCPVAEFVVMTDDIEKAADLAVEADKNQKVKLPTLIGTTDGLMVFAKPVRFIKHVYKIY